jgi:hypothetical protein
LLPLIGTVRSTDHTATSKPETCRQREPSANGPLCGPPSLACAKESFAPRRCFESRHAARKSKGRACDAASEGSTFCDGSRLTLFRLTQQSGANRRATATHSSTCGSSRADAFQDLSQANAAPERRQNPEGRAGCCRAQASLHPSGNAFFLSRFFRHRRKQPPAQLACCQRTRHPESPHRRQGFGSFGFARTLAVDVLACVRGRSANASQPGDTGSTSQQSPHTTPAGSTRQRTGKSTGEACRPSHLRPAQKVAVLDFFAQFVARHYGFRAVCGGGVSRVGSGVFERFKLAAT